MGIRASGGGVPSGNNVLKGTVDPSLVANLPSNPSTGDRWIVAEGTTGSFENSASLSPQGYPLTEGDGIEYDGSLFIVKESGEDVWITGGTITGITDLAIADGGTGASDAPTARTNLDVYSTTETDNAIDTDISTHNAVTTAHGISAFGSTLVDDADAASARFTLGLGAIAVRERATASDIDSEASTDGQVLTSDGAGNAAWETVVAGGGGALTVNEETLSATKTISDGDPIVQILDPNGTSRDVVLPAAPAEGSIFQIVNANALGNALLNVKVGTDTATISVLGRGTMAYFVYTTNGWATFGNGCSRKRTGTNAFESQDDTTVVLGYGANAFSASTIAIGRYATAATQINVVIGNGASVGSGFGTVLGHNASQGGSYGVAIGYQAQSGDRGVTVGGGGAGATNSTAINIGYGTDSGGSYQTNLGYSADGSTRFGAFTKGMTFGSGLMKTEEVAWLGTTTDATQTELYLAANGTNRVVLAANTAIGFRVQVVAREAATQDCKYWEVSGMIKRDGANNTSLVGSITKTVIGADAGAAAWDVDFDADDTNEALRFRVTGEASHTITWAATAQILDRR